MSGSTSRGVVVLLLLVDILDVLCHVVGANEVLLVLVLCFEELVGGEKNELH